MKIEIPCPDKIISIETAKNTTRYARRLFGECPHNRIVVDHTLTTIHCEDCNKDINPVIWISMLADEWDRINRGVKEYNEARKKYEERSKTKCQHCGKMTWLR